MSDLLDHMTGYHRTNPRIASRATDEGLAVAHARLFPNCGYGAPERLAVTVNDHQSVPYVETANVCVTDDDVRLNIRVTNEGMVLDSYDTDGNLLGTVCMTWAEWADYLKGR